MATIDVQRKCAKGLQIAASECLFRIYALRKSLVYFCFFTFKTHKNDLLQNTINEYVSTENYKALMLL